MVRAANEARSQVTRKLRVTLSDVQAKLVAAQNCHPNAVQVLISEALDAIDVVARSEARPAISSPLSSLELMKTVMQADEALVGRCIRGTTNWAAAIGKAVQDAVIVAVEGPPGSGGWKTHAEAMERERDYHRQRAQVMRDHQSGQAWYWQDDGGDHLESMVNSLPVVIRADQLRALVLAAANAERERICTAIKAEDDHCVDNGDYMLDSDDCIKVARGQWVRPDFSLRDEQKAGA